MLRTDYLSLLDVCTRDELLAKLVRHAQKAGFTIVAATSVLEMPDGTSCSASVNNVPEGYRSEFSNLDAARRDPVMQLAKRSSLPIVWNRQTYLDAGQADLWEDQAQFGFSAGVALAMHLPGGRHFIFGLDRDQALPMNSMEITRMVADINLLAVFSQDVVLRLALPTAAGASPSALTRRELECLRWTMEGKTAWELSRILGISEHTAVRHIFNASRKLGCANKLQAAVRALRLGLIQ